MFFYDRLILLSIMSLRFIHIVRCVKISFLLRLNNMSLNTYIIFCLSVDEHLGFFYLLAIINNAAMYVGAKISLRGPFIYFGYTEVELFDYMVILCLIVLRTVILFSSMENGCTILLAHPQCTKVSIYSPLLSIYRIGIAGSYGNSFLFFEKMPYCFP